MFYSLDPTYTSEISHYPSQHSALFSKHGDDFCVLAHKSLSVEKALPYKVINFFSVTTWQALSSESNFEKFKNDLLNLNKIVQNGDTLFMYMGDVHFIFPILKALVEESFKVKFVLNLIHSARYFSGTRNYLDRVKVLINNSKELRNKVGLFLTVETEKGQLEYKELCNEVLPVLPLFHSESFKNNKKINHDKLIVSFLSAHKNRGSKQVVELIKFIFKNDKSLFNSIDFQIRVTQQRDENLDVVKEIDGLVNIQFGHVTNEEYEESVLQTDVMLLPYPSSIFYVRTSGVFNDAILNRIAVVATTNTWLGDNTRKYNIGETFYEDDINDFYNSLKRVLDNLEFYKNNCDVHKNEWVQKNSVETLNHLIDSFDIVDNNDNKTFEEVFIKNQSNSPVKYDQKFFSYNLYQVREKRAISKRAYSYMKRMLRSVV